MNLLEIVCLSLVALWVALRLWKEPDRKALLGRLLIIMVSAWIGEDSCIRVYGFYFYDDAAWSVVVDKVPLLIVLIWPVVITSALDLGNALDVKPSRWPLLLFVLVVVDAWFIEPIAVDAGLWKWTHDGAFDVPVIGVLGWGCFAAGVGVVVWKKLPFAALVVVGPLVCHLLLFALWWGALRWLPTSTNEVIKFLGAWVVGLAVVGVVAAKRPRGLRFGVALRVPAAVFFFGLLAVHGRDADDLLLWGWSLAFAPPWLAVFALSSASSTDQRTPAYGPT